MPEKKPRGRPPKKTDPVEPTPVEPTPVDPVQDPGVTGQDPGNTGELSVSLMSDTNAESKLSVMLSDNSDIIGKQISINPKADPIFKIGDIHLTVQRYWATVSPNMPEEYYEVIRRSLNMGYIVLGKQQLPSRDLDPTVLSEYWKIIDKNGNNAIGKQTIKNLIKMGTDRQLGGYHFWEVIDYCLKKEKETVSRKEVIDFLEDAMQFKETDYRSPRVFHEEEGRIEIDLGELVKASAESSTPRRPEGHKDLGKSAEDSLNEAFGD